MANQGVTMYEKPVQFKDMSTNEEFEGSLIVKRLSEEDFLKVQIGDLLKLLGILESKQADVVIYILKNMEFSKNFFYGTYDEIAKGSEISRATVTRTMTQLTKAHLIAKVRNGVYQVNPALAYKGNDKHRAYILRYYEEHSTDPDADYVESAKAPQKKRQPGLTAGEK